MKCDLLNKDEFDSLSMNEKRVAICKDVIERIYIDLLIPQKGVFWFNRGEVRESSWNKSLQEAINSTKCYVCAKGALFTSWVGNFNKVEWDLASGYSMEEVYRLKRAAPELVEIFGENMLDNIEAVFEGESYDWHDDRDLSDKYAEAYENFSLKEIMEIIIENGGEFPLPKTT